MDKVISCGCELLFPEKCSCGCTNQLLDGNCLYPEMDQLVQQLVDALAESRVSYEIAQQGPEVATIHINKRDAVLAAAATLGYQPAGGVYEYH